MSRLKYKDANNNWHYFADMDDVPTDAKQDEWDSKSTVSVSNTGTATDEVKFITIDGVEKKIAGGGINISQETYDIIVNDPTHNAVLDAPDFGDYYFKVSSEVIDLSINEDAYFETSDDDGGLLVDDAVPFTDGLGFRGDFVCSGVAGYHEDDDGNIVAFPETGTYVFWDAEGDQVLSINELCWHYKLFDADGNDVTEEVLSATNPLPPRDDDLTENGKFLGVSGDLLAWKRVLPKVKRADAGKVLTVDEDGNWVAAELPVYDGTVV